MASEQQTETASEQRQDQDGAQPTAGGEDGDGREEMRALEEADEVPSDPRDWPGGKAKYFTFGGGEDKSNEPYGDDITGKLGPSDVHHQPDGSVLVRGEKVDDPERFKGEPIPGGPTDPKASDIPANRQARAMAEDHDSESDGSAGDSRAAGDSPSGAQADPEG